MPAAPGRIVVGVDGSPSSQRALDWAIDEARRSGASLHLVAAWMFPMALGYALTATVHQVHQAAQDVIDGALAHVAERAPTVTATGETVEQLPAPALVTAAKGADLLVVGSRGHGGFEGLLQGSISLNCTRHADCSVVVVR